MYAFLGSTYFTYFLFSKFKNMFWTTGFFWSVPGSRTHRQKLVKISTSHMQIKQFETFSWLTWWTTKGQIFLLPPKPSHQNLLPMESLTKRVGKLLTKLNLIHFDKLILFRNRNSWSVINACLKNLPSILRCILPYND